MPVFEVAHTRTFTERKTVRVNAPDAETATRVASLLEDESFRTENEAMQAFAELKEYEVSVRPAPEDAPDFVACAGCGEGVHVDEVTYARADGSLSTASGQPYCDACLPEEAF